MPDAVAFVEASVAEAAWVKLASRRSVFAVGRCL
jgi:hypothetical protein